MLGPQQVPVQAVMDPSQQTVFPPSAWLRAAGVGRLPSQLGAQEGQGAAGDLYISRDLYITVWRYRVYIIHTKL